MKTLEKSVQAANNRKAPVDPEAQRKVVPSPGNLVDCWVLTNASLRPWTEASILFLSNGKMSSGKRLVALGLIAVHNARESICTVCSTDRKGRVRQIATVYCSTVMVRYLARAQILEFQLLGLMCPALMILTWKPEQQCQQQESPRRANYLLVTSVLRDGVLRFWGLCAELNCIFLRLSGKEGGRRAASEGVGGAFCSRRETAKAPTWRGSKVCCM